MGDSGPTDGQRSGGAHERQEQDPARLVVVAARLRLLRRRAGGHPGGDPAADDRRAGRGGRQGAGLPARLRHHWAGPELAAAGQPDRLALCHRRAGLVAVHPRGPVALPAGRRAPPAPAGRPGRRRVRGAQLGASDRPGRSPCWRPVAAAGVAAAALVLVGDGLAPARLEDLPIANPFGLAGPAGTVASMMAGAGTILWVASMVASVACVVLRFRAARGVERQQLRWVAAGAGAAVAGLLAGAAVPQSSVISSILYAMVLCIPLGVAVAVLRYRLWDLDRLVSRTVTYTLVTALLVVPYLLIVPAAGRLAQGAGNLAVAAATLAAAAAFAPLGRRVQGLVDRRFNRRRYDAARTVEAFTVRLRDQVDLDALSAELLAVVDQTMQPVGASLWLRPPATPRPPRYVDPTDLNVLGLSRRLRRAGRDVAE